MKTLSASLVLLSVCFGRYTFAEKTAWDILGTGVMNSVSPVQQASLSVINRLLFAANPFDEEFANPTRYVGEAAERILDYVANVGSECAARRACRAGDRKSSVSLGALRSLLAWHFQNNLPEETTTALLQKILLRGSLKSGILFSIAPFKVVLGNFRELIVAALIVGLSAFLTWHDYLLVAGTVPWPKGETLFLLSPLSWLFAWGSIANCQYVASDIGDHFSLVFKRLGATLTSIKISVRSLSCLGALGKAETKTGSGSSYGLADRIHP